MRLLKVAAGVVNTTPLDWRGNAAAVLESIAAAREQGVGVLCLPEMCLCGYGCEDAFLSPGVVQTAWEVLAEVAPACEGIVVSLGLPIPFRNALYNCAALVADGRLLGLAAKKFLAGDGIHYEPRWFKPWPREVVAELERDGGTWPLGDVYFEVGGVRIGFEICEDAWVAARPGGALALKGVDIILNPSASHFAFGKQEVRERYVLEGSRAFGVTYVYANLLGNEAGRVIYDGGALIATGGKMAAIGPRLTFDRWRLTTAVVDLDLTRMQQARLSSFQPDLEERPEERVEAPFRYPASALELAAPRRQAWELAEQHREEEFTRAVALGLFDYLRKSRSHGFVVSLSGGADSAAVAVLVALMVELSWQEQGPEELRARLAHVPGLDEATAPPQLVERLLTTLYQATRNSTQATREAARAVASAVGARHLELDVEPLVSGYVQLIEEALGRRLSWQSDDVALQNIQARVRAPAAWLVANLRNALLLATSNRSEAAVGYATMDGDTAGGLSPIAGIDKAFLRRWLGWMETSGPTGLRPVPELSAVTALPPT
ncbi:MAG TPA: nitrilase-related carbon-nitrogen hydrolase, partial [Thermoanaerobaculia bacterium]|nr:nitrilase-related carbon-nitrogen hydrolase [Thermoanaerobaculia bacterium]